MRLFIFSGVEDNSGEEGTNGDGKLIETNDGTADGLGGTLGLVHGHEA